MKPQDFDGTEPRLVLEDYFKGTTQAVGIFEDRFGRLRRQFVVNITGVWSDGVLTLDERFDYADGGQDRRVWRITKIDDHAYIGRADDVIGEAAGSAFGRAANWKYQMDLKVGTGAWRVTFDDWLFLQPRGVLMNRAKVKKWGFKLGEVTLVFAKDPAPADIAQEILTSSSILPKRRKLLAGLAESHAFSR